MEDERWYQPEEVASLLGIKPDSVVRRAHRVDESSKESFVRHVQSSADGGKPRVEIHAELVDRWLPHGSSGQGASDELEQSALRDARQSNAQLHAELHTLEISTRDKEIARLTESLMEREFEVAELRTENGVLSERVEELGSVIASLTKARKS